MSVMSPGSTPISCNHAHGRNPVGNAERLGHGDAVAFLHEPAVDQDVLLAAARQHECKGQIDVALVVGPLQQGRDRLVLAARILQNEYLPDSGRFGLLLVCGHFYFPSHDTNRVITCGRDGIPRAR